jgi:hypothetical protein
MGEFRFRVIVDILIHGDPVPLLLANTLAVGTNGQKRTHGIEYLFFRVPETQAEDLEYFNGYGRIAHDDLLQILSIEKKDLRFAPGDDTGRPRQVVQERHLPDKIMGTEPPQLDFILSTGVFQDLDLAADNDIESPVGFAFPDDELAVLKKGTAARPCDDLQLFFGKLGKKRDIGQYLQAIHEKPSLDFLLHGG